VSSTSAIEEVNVAVLPVPKGYLDALLVLQKYFQLSLQRSTPEVLRHD
jgi:hypothetical protein